EAERRYSAPYWTIHRGDLQSALVAAARAQDVEVKLDTRVEAFATHVTGITVQARRGRTTVEERGVALIGADGLWSNVRAQLPGTRPPKFRHRTAWRALIPANAVPAEFREPLVHLWLGLDAHLVHYPVKSGRLINIVAIVHDQWLKWALYDSKTPFRGGVGAVTLIGDAAHPMLPFLAQGAGMAIEDAAVLADMLGKHHDDPSAALRAYEGARGLRAARAQLAARRQARVYGLTGPEALIRNLAMRAMGGEKLRARYDWLYDWQ